MDAPRGLAVTDLTGIIVARPAFENSFRYRSAVLFGTFARLAGPDAPRALDVLTERLLPGRLAEVRPTRQRELAATDTAWRLLAGARFIMLATTGPGGHLGVDTSTSRPNRGPPARRGVHAPRPT